MTSRAISFHSILQPEGQDANHPGVCNLSFLFNRQFIFVCFPDFTFMSILILVLIKLFTDHELYIFTIFFEQVYKLYICFINCIKKQHKTKL